MNKRTDRRKPLQTAKSPRSPDVSAVKDRLDQLLGAGKVQRAAEIAPTPTARRPITAVVEGTSAEGVFTAEVLYPLDVRHGAVEVDRLGELCPKTRILFPEHFDEGHRVADLRFLDTETTGLAHVAGTVPFLVGVGRWIEGTGFTVRQFFLEDFPAERAMLLRVAEELEGASRLVTYNGRSFDIPLLEKRFNINNLPPPARGVDHLDLLHPCRTLWRDSLPDCKLQTLERELLGFHRVGDVPGAEIPGLYADYRKRGASRRLADVFTHNALDILSLAALLAGLGGFCEEGTASTRAAVALLHARRGRAEEAARQLEEVAGEEVGEELHRSTLRHLLVARKREGDWPGVLDAARALMALPFDADPFPFEEAAKVEEHRNRDATAALAVVEMALSLGPWVGADRARLERRRERLTRKCEKK